MSASKSAPLILAVDDHPEILAAISEMLEGTYRVVGVKDSIDVIDALERHEPVLFILDIEMPMINGYDVAGIIRMDERFSKTPILFLTGTATKDSVVKAVQSGGTDYIVKPVEKRLLLEKIAKYVNARARPFSRFNPFA